MAPAPFVALLRSPFEGGTTMSQSLELPDAIYHALVEAAEASGATPVDWIADKLPKRAAPLTEEARHAANARLREHTVSLGYATGIDNERIDADLAREYGEDHARLYRPEGKE
jgi:hypothetical protein